MENEIKNTENETKNTENDVKKDSGFAKFLILYLVASIISTIALMLIGKEIFSNGFCKFGLYIVGGIIIVILSVRVGFKKYPDFNCWVFALIVLLQPYFVDIIILKNPLDLIFDIFDESGFVDTLSISSYLNVIVLLVSSIIINQLSIKKREITDFLGYQSFIDFIAKFNTLSNIFSKFVVTIGFIIIYFLKRK